MSMRLLIIISSHELNEKWYDNIIILNDYMKMQDIEVDYCGISSQNDFHHYESIISFTYKILSHRQQFRKVFDFIHENKSKLNYDWYMKIRPDVKLLENIDFTTLSTNAVNARARVYYGPKKIKYGMSVNGEGIWKNIGDCYHCENERVILDDQIYMFTDTVIKMNAFEPFHEDRHQSEWAFTYLLLSRNIPMNVIGIPMVLTKYNTYSGHINMI
jgi:hypothetical protein